MTLDPLEFQLLQDDKIKIVQQLTELNSRHILSQGRLSGIEIETVRCKQAIDKGDTSENFNQELDRLMLESDHLMQTRAEIDSERVALELKLQEIDNLLNR